MHRKPALTFSGALRILGRHDSGVVAALDKALGGAVLAAGTGVVLPAALWGWVDQKNEAVRLLGGLVGGLSDRLAGVRGLERREAILAAHTTLVAAAFFEVLEETLGRAMRDLAITEEERRFLVTGDRTRTALEYHETLYRSEVPAPSPSCGFQENLRRVVDWLVVMTNRVDLFIGDLVTERRLTVRFGNDFRRRALSRYESHYLRLAQNVPEFVFWAVLGEHAATRHRIDALGADLRAALDSRDQALSKVSTLLALVSGRADIGRHREGLHRANTGVLDRPVVPGDAERYDTEITFPTTERAFVTPHYRIATHDRKAQPADENWWSDRAVLRDLEVMIAVYLTSADATRAPMVVLGHPGAGKSLLTKVLAARLPPEEYTVVRVPLRNVAAGAPIIDQVQQALDAATNNRVRWHEVTDDSADTVLVVLLDGLDELLQAAAFDRSGYLREVMEFQRIEEEQNRPVAVVVTSRTVVADRVDIPHGSPVVKLEEFTDDQVTAWLDEWRAANAAAIQAGLVRPLTSGEALHQRDLARQPLLLLMLALYAADPRSPKLDAGLSTSALYERIFDNFARREVRKRAGTRLREDEVERRVDDQVFRLSVAALAMFNRGVQHAREVEVRADLAGLTGRTDLSDDAGTRLLGEFFFVHAPEAVLRGRERSYEFLHATFGEYLVALHVVSELAALANAAYGGRYGDRPLDDEVLFALLSHQVWAARPSITEFAAAIFGTMPDEERRNVRRALEELLRSYRQRRRSARFDGYRPTPLDLVRQVAVYSANLTTLATWCGDPATGLDLVGPFGDDQGEALGNWRSALFLWRSGLDPDSWQALLFSLNTDGTTLSPTRPAVPSGKAGVDEYWLARIGADPVHAARVQRGMGLVDDHIFLERGSGWTDHMLTWIVPVLVSPRKVSTSLLVDPPGNASTEDLQEVGRALSLLLRIRGRTLGKEFTLRAVKSLAEYPVPFGIDMRTVLTVAHLYPEILLAEPRWQNRAFYGSLGPALHVIVDRAERLLGPQPLPEWDEVRARLLSENVPMPPSSDTFADLFLHFD
ncbi:NACHT domain-containing protein [Saccharothrix lopnurensis]|uniref:NACHT domain-containing protein n=1 Tax=Saccharothrix lopnurensis TaxID=1670621 RepID=A0ABW1P7K6_9PSEU